MAHEGRPIKSKVGKRTQVSHEITRGEASDNDAWFYVVREELFLSTPCPSTIRSLIREVDISGLL